MSGKSLPFLDPLGVGQGQWQPPGKGRLARSMPNATLRKLHSFTGLFPLGAYLFFHAYEHFAIREGRDALITRLDRTTDAPLEVVCVILPLLLHAALGLVIASTKDASALYASPSFFRLQVTSGVLAGAFLAWHVATIWGARVVQGRPAAAYGAMQAHVGTLPAAAAYVLGVSAVCVHFAQGLSVALLRSGRLHLSPRATRILCGLLGGGLWVIFIDELMAYVTGAPLL